MDKVKAIKVLKPLVDSYVDYANITMKEEDDDIADALEMAIEALKALDVPDTNVGDMISRQMAIDALFELYEYQRYIDPTEAADRVRQGVYLAEKKIEQLPSVQPDHVADISKKVEGDLISRQAAIDVIEAGILTKLIDAETAVNGLKGLPSAQPEIVECKDCKYNVSSHKCLHPESFFLVPDDDFYCGYAERRTDETD